MDRVESNVWTSHFLPPLKGANIVPFDERNASVDEFAGSSTGPVIKYYVPKTVRQVNATPTLRRNRRKRKVHARPHPFRESAALFLPIISVRAYSADVRDE